MDSRTQERRMKKTQEDLKIDTLYKSLFTKMNGNTGEAMGVCSNLTNMMSLAQQYHLLSNQQPFGDEKWKALDTIRQNTRDWKEDLANRAKGASKEWAEVFQMKPQSKTDYLLKAAEDVKDRTKEQIRERAEDVREGAKQTVETAKEFGQNLSDTIKEKAADVDNWMNNSAKKNEQAKEDARKVPGLVEREKDGALAIIKDVTSALSEKGEQVKQKTEDVAAAIKREAEYLVDEVRDESHYLRDEARELKENAERKASNSWENAKHTMEAAKNKVVEKKDAAEHRVGEKLEGAERRMENMKEGAKEKAVEWKDAAERKVGEDMKGTKQKMEDMKEGAKQKMEDMKDTKQKMEDMKEGAKQKMEDMKEGAKQKMEDMKEGAKQKMEDMKEGAKHKMEDMKEGAKEKAVEWKDAAERKMGEKVENVKEGAKQKMEDMKEGAKEKAVEWKDATERTMGDKVENMKEGTKQKIHEASDNVKGKVGGMLEEASKKLEDMKDGIKEVVIHARDTVVETIQGPKKTISVDKEINQEGTRVAKIMNEKRGMNENNSERMEEPVDMISKGVSVVKEAAKEAVDTVKQKANLAGDTIKEMMSADTKTVETYLKPTGQGRTIQERLDYLDTMERQTKLLMNKSNSDIQNKVNQIQELLREEGGSSPSRYAPCLEGAQIMGVSFDEQGSQLKKAANTLYGAENCWFGYMLRLQQCQQSKNSVDCYKKAMSTESNCISQSREGLSTLKHVLDESK